MIFIELNGICNWMKGWPFYTIFIFVKFFDNLTFRYPEMAKGILKDQTDINISKQEKVFVGENKWNGFQQCLHNISYPPHNHSRWNIFNANIIVISVFFGNVNVNLSSKSPALSLSLSSSSSSRSTWRKGGRGEALRRALVVAVSPVTLTCNATWLGTLHTCSHCSVLNRLCTVQLLTCNATPPALYTVHNA